MNTGAQGTIADVLAGRSRWAYECRDGFALAREMGDAAVDHVVGDPPYDDHTHGGMRTNRGAMKFGNGSGALDLDVGVSTAGTDESDIDFAAIPPIDSFLPAILSCSRRWSILFCSSTMLGAYLAAAGGWRTPGSNVGAFVRDGTWHRTNSAPQKTGDRPAQGCEALAIMHRPGGKMRWHRGGHQAFWEGPIAEKRAGRHPTKKPLWLMEALLRDFTDPDDLVFDPTGGEGTTGEACMKLRRRFIGCEIDPKYHAAGVARIGRAAAGLKQTEWFT